jgi:hypothetical protein
MKRSSISCSLHQSVNVSLVSSGPLLHRMAAGLPWRSARNVAGSDQRSHAREQGRRRSGQQARTHRLDNPDATWHIVQAHRPAVRGLASNHPSLRGPKEDDETVDRHTVSRAPENGHHSPRQFDRNRMRASHHGLGATALDSREAGYIYANSSRCSTKSLQIRGGPYISAENVLDCRILQRQVGIHALQLGVLRLELTQPLELRHPGAAVFRFPVVVGCRADAVLARELGDRDPASPSLRIATICDSVNRDFFIRTSGEISCQKSPVIAVYRKGKLTVEPKTTSLNEIRHSCREFAAETSI